MRNKIVILILGIVLFSSCESWVEENPYGVYSNDNFFESADDALSALLYAYDPLNYIEYGSRFIFDIADATTDQMITYGKGEQAYRIEMFNWTFTSSNTVISGFFKYCYLSIARSNSVLENIPKIESIQDGVRDQYMGEAYFLRAFNYFYLVRTYGEVPVRTKVVADINDVKVDFSSIEEVYALIIEDLEKAADLMSVRKQQGRADRVAAQALLTKVYATLASSKMTGAEGYDWVADYETMYAEAKKYGQLVVEGQGDYRLDPDLLGLYEVDNHETSPEHIFMLSQKRFLSGEEGNFSQMPQMFVISLPKVYVSSELDMVGNVYPMVNNQSWAVFRTDSTFYKSYAENDKRQDLFVSKIYDANGSLLAEYHPSNIDSEDQILSAFYYPFCRKYSDPESDGTKTSANPYFIRFADVALLYAEACGNTEEGYHWVNQVRSRAGLDELDTGLSLDDFRKAVWNERKYELAFEGHRLYDLRRTNRVVEEITNKTVDANYTNFFPIPQRETDLNQ